MTPVEKARQHALFNKVLAHTATPDEQQELKTLIQAENDEGVATAIAAGFTPSPAGEGALTRHKARKAAKR